jgi:chromosome segregation ATPase
MKNDEIIKVLIISFAMFLFAGCQRNQQIAEEAKLKAAEQNESVSKRFQPASSSSEGGTTIDSALRLAQEHAKLSEKYSASQQQNLELTEQNGRLKERLAILEPELKQTNKELEEANKLVVDMRIELNNWKADTIGFRDEMREADKVQLETLLKILETLGGEVNAPAVSSQGVNAETENNVQGDPNEKK